MQWVLAPSLEQGLPCLPGAWGELGGGGMLLQMRVCQLQPFSVGKANCNRNLFSAFREVTLGTITRDRLNSLSHWFPWFIPFWSDGPKI